MNGSSRPARSSQSTAPHTEDTKMCRGSVKPAVPFPVIVIGKCSLIIAERNAIDKHRQQKLLSLRFLYPARSVHQQAVFPLQRGPGLLNQCILKKEPLLFLLLPLLTSGCFVPDSLLRHTFHCSPRGRIAVSVEEPCKSVLMFAASAETRIRASLSRVEDNQQP